MLWIKAFHIMSFVAWFAGIFYLPRLFVYHSDTSDQISLERFKVMERRLFFGIMTPAAIATTLFGGWMLVTGWDAYRHMGWMHAKLTLVVILWIYHLTCWHHLRQFAKGQNRCSAFFFRVYNELPVFLLFGIVVLVMVRPF